MFVRSDACRKQVQCHGRCSSVKRLKGRFRLAPQIVSVTYSLQFLLCRFVPPNFDRAEYPLTGSHAFCVHGATGEMSSARPPGTDWKRTFKIEPQARIESAAKEVHDDNQRKPGEFRRTPVLGKRSGTGSLDHRGDVRVGLLRKPW